MCGIFGLISNDQTKRVSVDRAVRMARGVEKRGPHAWGVSWIDRDGRIGMYKQPGSILHSIPRFRDIVRDAVMIIGHCRWATHGHPSDNACNHPHPVDGGWLVHNGQIEDAEDCIEDYRLNMVTECDSEIFSHLFATEPGSISERVTKSIEYAQAYGDKKPAHAVAVLLSRPARLVVARSGKPLQVACTKAQTLTWSTTGIGIGREPVSLPDGAALSVSYKGGRVKTSLRRNAIPLVTDGNLLY